MITVGDERYPKGHVRNDWCSMYLEHSIFGDSFHRKMSGMETIDLDKSQYKRVNESKGKFTYDGQEYNINDFQFGEGVISGRLMTLTKEDHQGYHQKITGTFRVTEINRDHPIFKSMRQPWYKRLLTRMKSWLYF